MEITCFIIIFMVNGKAQIVMKFNAEDYYPVNIPKTNIYYNLPI